MTTIYRVQAIGKDAETFEYFDTLIRAVEFCDKLPIKDELLSLTIDKMYIANGATITRSYYIK